MRRVTLIVVLFILLCGCSRQISEVVEKYDNGNWKKVIVYKVSGDTRELLKSIEYYEDGSVKREIDLRKTKDYNASPNQSAQNEPVEPEPQNKPLPNEEINYTGPYADLMNQPGAEVRKLEGEEKERVLEAMRRRREEQEEGEQFTELNDEGEEIEKIRKILEFFEDGSVKHEQIYENTPGGPVLERDIEYYSNGQINTFVPYVGGIAHGKWLNYYRDGSLKTVGNSRNGNHNGEYIQYYTNGNAMMIGNFLNGKMEGKWQYFWENGNLQMETVFSEDRDIGPMQRYDENGEPLKKQSPFQVGESYDFDDK
jgi:antitoxin component YwqK of YwqJK toxin-antitoxin module